MCKGSTKGCCMSRWVGFFSSTTQTKTRTHAYIHTYMYKYTHRRVVWWKLICCDLPPLTPQLARVCMCTSPAFTLAIAELFCHCLQLRWEIHMLPHVAYTIVTISMLLQHQRQLQLRFPSYMRRTAVMWQQPDSSWQMWKCRMWQVAEFKDERWLQIGIDACGSMAMRVFWLGNLHAIVVVSICVCQCVLKLDEMNVASMCSLVWRVFCVEIVTNVVWTRHNNASSHWIYHPNCTIRQSGIRMHDSCTCHTHFGICNGYTGKWKAVCLSGSSDRMLAHMFTYRLVSVCMYVLQQ